MHDMMMLLNSRQVKTQGSAAVACQQPPNLCRTQGEVPTYEDGVVLRQWHELGHDIIPQRQVEDAKRLKVHLDAILEV